MDRTLQERIHNETNQPANIHINNNNNNNVNNNNDNNNMVSRMEKNEKMFALMSFKSELLLSIVFINIINFKS
jgi:hypothetical protein